MGGLCRNRVWIFKISCINNQRHSSNFNFTFRSCWIWCHNLSGHYLGTDPRQFDQFDLSHMNDRIKIRDQQSWPQLWIQWLRQHLQKSDIFCTIGRQIWSPFKWTLGSSRDCIHLFLLVFESEGNHVHEVRYPHFPSCVTLLWVLSQISYQIWSLWTNTGYRIHKTKLSGWRSMKRWSVFDDLCYNFHIGSPTP